MIGQDELAERFPDGLALKHLRAVDPDSTPAAEPAWRALFDDIAATGL
jgi:hypothetical protein